MAEFAPGMRVLIRDEESNIISMFWNATTCQKRKIPGRKKAQNDNTAPASDAVYSSITGTGAFLF